MLSAPPKVQIFVSPDNRLELKIEDKSEDFAPVSLAVTLAERDLGMVMGPMLGSSGGKDWGSYTFQIKEGTGEVWRKALLGRLGQHAEEAYLERGPNAGEPDFSHLNEESSDPVLRQWVRAYYAADGITDPPSLAEVEVCRKAYFALLDLRLFKKDLAGQNYPTDASVRAYARALEAGVAFPPLIVRRSRNHYHVLEGFHRLNAYFRIGRSEIPCVVLGSNLPG